MNRICSYCGRNMVQIESDGSWVCSDAVCNAEHSHQHHSFVGEVEERRCPYCGRNMVQLENSDR